MGQVQDGVVGSSKSLEIVSECLRCFDASIRRKWRHEEIDAKEFVLCLFRCGGRAMEELTKEEDKPSHDLLLYTNIFMLHMYERIQTSCTKQCLEETRDAEGFLKCIDECLNNTFKEPALLYRDVVKHLAKLLGLYQKLQNNN